MPGDQGILVPAQVARHAPSAPPTVRHISCIPIWLHAPCSFGRSLSSPEKLSCSFGAARCEWRVQTIPTKARPCRCCNRPGFDSRNSLRRLVPSAGRKSILRASLGASTNPTPVSWPHDAGARLFSMHFWKREVNIGRLRLFLARSPISGWTELPLAKVKS